ncbi:DNA replication/repair protein RecF [Vineibacter terrae]|uniref:DNA replication/repair protein RecF n=1 Tax=Vineibacter terrae TaxID=2586908 RepID=UPI002E35F2A6|nr:DNA replication/repair protein RecF [Vineibacter terrae]HEX2889670.1 DNA replication/repair protein RecF [Vineibacter terrae]
MSGGARPAFAHPTADTTAPALPFAPAAGPLAVRQLRLTEFRNYQRLRVELEPTSVVLVGDNGAGKTNLLEAVSFLAPGRGLRRSRLDEVQRGVRPSEPPPLSGWAVAAVLDVPGGRVAIGTGLESAPAANGDGEATRRVVRIDGRAAPSQLALGEHVAAIWLTPQLDRIWVDGPGNRRRFLDRMVSAFDPAHAGSLAAYDQAMRQRARLLAEGRTDAHWFAAVEDTMARHGVALTAARHDLVARLDQAARLGVGPFPRASLALTGEVEAWVATMAALDAEDQLRARLAANRGLDAQAGATLCGPHRADLAVRHLDRDIPAAQGSTGEQKAVLVAIVLAHARLATLARGRPPLLLLDEIAAHLDARKRAALFAEITALGAQAWMTGTDAAAFAPLAGQAQFLRIEAGEIAPS